MKRNNLRNVWPYLIFAMICAALGGFLLTQIIYTYAVRQTNNSVVTFQVHLHNNQFRRLVVKPRRYQRDFTQSMLDRLMLYLQEAYPSMLVGVQHATDYKELKRQARG